MPPETKRPTSTPSPDNGNEAEAADKSRRNSNANKRILKNTLALYFRQILIMLVSLYTVRVVLETLGVEDYGIYNVVAGVVAMFSFISGTLVNITQRFITVELGKGGDINVLRKIFSTSVILHVAAAVAVVLLAETAGLWFLNNKLVIPADRMAAANWVFQFAVFGFVVTMLNAPLTALIISHEDMHIYGYAGILEVAAKLGAVYLLLIINADKLITFALFHFAVVCIICLFYFVYCRKKYRYARFAFVYDKSIAKGLSGFGGYTFADCIFAALIVHGTNIIMNIFFGPAVNAAKGLANSVNMAVQSFGNSFRQALVPQITKSYYSEDKNLKWDTAERGTRILYFLLFLFSVPMLLKTEFLLKLWLGNVPEYTVIFTQLVIIDVLLAGPVFGLRCVMLASEKYKTWYNILFAINTLVLAFSYLVCKTGYPPYYVFLIFPSLRLLFFPVQLILAKKALNLSIRFFAKKIFAPVAIVSVVSVLPLYYVNNLLPASFFYACATIITSMLWTGIVIMAVGLRKNERVKIFAFAKRKLSGLM